MPPLTSILNLIGGELVPAHAGGALDNVEPATGARYSTLPDSGPEDADRAVEAAHRAFPAWAATPPQQRAALLNRLADLIERDLEPLARAESIDTGKPIALARAMDIPRAAANFRFFAQTILNRPAETYQTTSPAPAPASSSSHGPHSTSHSNQVLRQPLGVVALISPWNLPLYLLSWKIAPALACGNTAVCKPSELTPMTAYLLAKLSLEADLPPGVLNIIHGTGPRAGAPLTTHPLVKAISFTGGTATGRAISAAAAPLFKKLSLELGGKNPTIVFADVDTDAAAAQAVRAAFSNQGQICLCGSRVLVERSIYTTFLDRFLAHTRTLKQGDPLDESTQQGALVSAQHLAKVRSYVELARAEGGTVELGGAPPDPGALPARCRDGYFLQPTVITGLAPSTRVMQEEIFGPVACIAPFESEAQAVATANCTPYGLSASVWSADPAKAQRVAEHLDAGTVWINCWLVRDLRVPFGGVKQSGLGREGGEDAIRFFTEAKTVCTRRDPPR